MILSENVVSFQLLSRNWLHVQGSILKWHRFHKFLLHKNADKLIFIFLNKYFLTLRLKIIMNNQDFSFQLTALVERHKCLRSQKILNSSQPQKISWSVHFDGICKYLHPFRRKSSWCSHPVQNNCCFRDQGNTGYNTNRFTEIGFDIFINFLLWVITCRVLLLWRYLLLNMV